MVRIFQWPDGKLVGMAYPAVNGDWSFQPALAGSYGLTYIASGCQPITHGPYLVDTGIWTPIELDPLLWLDASDHDTLTLDGLNNVEGWADKGSAGHHVEQTRGSVRAVDLGVNGRPSVSLGFNGFGEIVFAASIAISSAYTMFFVKQPFSWNGNNPGIWRGGSDSRGGDNFVYQGSTGRPAIRRNNTWALEPASGYGLPLNEPALVSISVDDQGASYRNLAVERHYNSHAISSTGFQLHRMGWQYDSAEYMGAHFGEILILSGIPDNETRQQIEGYLAEKWGLRGQLPDHHPHAL